MDDMMEYGHGQAAKIDDIGKDTDNILKMLKGGDRMGEHFDNGFLTGMLSNRDNGFGGDNGLALIILLLLLGGGNGFGGMGGGNIAGVDRTVINEANYTRLMDAINTSGTRQEMAINSLASAIGCDSKAMAAALASVDKQLAVNQGSVTNAIQSCCCNIQSSIDKCCCQTNLNIERTGNNIITAQTQGNQAIINAINAQTVVMNDKFCALELREKENQIEALRTRLLEQSQDAQTKVLLNAIANKNSIAYTGLINGSTVTGTGTLS